MLLIAEKEAEAKNKILYVSKSSRKDYHHYEIISLRFVELNYLYYYGRVILSLGKIVQMLNKLIRLMESCVVAILMLFTIKDSLHLTVK